MRLEHHSRSGHDVLAMATPSTSYQSWLDDRGWRRVSRWEKGVNLSDPNSWVEIRTQDGREEWEGPMDSHASVVALENAWGELRLKMEYLIPAYVLVLVSEGQHKRQGEIHVEGFELWGGLWLLHDKRAVKWTGCIYQCQGSGIIAASWQHVESPFRHSSR